MTARAWPAVPAGRTPPAPQGRPGPRGRPPRSRRRHPSHPGRPSAPPPDRPSRRLPCAHAPGREAPRRSLRPHRRRRPGQRWQRGCPRHRGRGRPGSPHRPSVGRPRPMRQEAPQPPPGSFLPCSSLHLPRRARCNTRGIEETPATPVALATLLVHWRRQRPASSYLRIPS